MSFLEAVETEVHGKFGLEKSSLVLFKEICDALEKLYHFLLQPVLHFIQNTAGRETYLETDAEQVFRVHMNEQTQRVLATLQKNKKIRFGTTGDHDLYFSLEDQAQIITFEKKANRVFDQPLQTNAIILPEYRRAFNILEQLGSIREIIANPSTGVITLFLEAGTEYLISPSDQNFTELAAILSGKMIEVGTIISDPLCFFPPIGFYNKATGKQVTSFGNETVLLNPSVFSTIELYLAALRVDYQPNPQNNSPVVISTTRGTQVIPPDDPRNAALQLLSDGKEPIQIGKCVGDERVYYRQGLGILTMFNRRPDYHLYLEVTTICETAKILPQGAHPYFDSSNFKTLYLLAPGMKSIVYKSNHYIFAVLKRLLQGEVGIIRDATSPDQAYLVSYDSDTGITYQKYDTTTNSSLQGKSIFTLAASSKKKLDEKVTRAPHDEKLVKKSNKKQETTRAKRQLERKHLPRK